jgi:hypothetical protein
MMQAQKSELNILNYFLKKLSSKNSQNNKDLATLKTSLSIVINVFLLFKIFNYYH